MLGGQQLREGQIACGERLQKRCRPREMTSQRGFVLLDGCWRLNVWLEHVTNAGQCLDDLRVAWLGFQLMPQP